MSALKAGQVAAERCLLTYTVEDSAHPITIHLESHADHRTADAELTLREAIRARDVLQETIELAARPTGPRLRVGRS